MNTKMKKELLNDVLTGLAVAGAFAAVAPGQAFAQLTQFVTNAGTQVVSPAMTALAYISYGLGAVLTVAGIANAKKHADNPSSNPLNPAIGKLGAGAAFLAAPGVVSVMQKTGSATAAGQGTGSSMTIGF